ncbi:MAG: folate family ECF transporter S component [Eubacteriales bacterium]|nr:folate family ECF transporter S component [Eubacteriales bacterium]
MQKNSESKSAGMSVAETLKSSLHELSSTRNLVICGMMAALAVVLGYVASIDLGPYIRIGFSGLPNRLVEFLFGPVVGCFFGGALDILKFLVKPTGTFFPGFTFNAMLAGVIYGFILYKKPVSIPRILAAEFLVKLIVNCGLNTLWISVLYGKGFFVLLPARLLKNAIMLPIDSAIIFLMLTLAVRLSKELGISVARAKN